MEPQSSKISWRRRNAFGPADVKGWVPFSFLQPVLLIAFLAIGIIPFMFLGEKVGWVDENEDTVGTAGLIAFLTILFSFFALASILWCAFVERRPLASMGLSLQRAGWRALRGWLIGVGMIFVILGAGLMLDIYEVAAIAPALNTPGQMIAIGLLAAAFLIQGGAEEIVYRGWLVSSFAIRRGLRAAIIVSMLLFTLSHFSPSLPPLAFVNLLLFSLLAVLWAIHEKSVIGIAAWHGGWNWVLATGFNLRLTGMDPVTSAWLVELKPQGTVLMTGGDLGPEGSIICTAVLSLALAFVWLKMKVARAS